MSATVFTKVAKRSDRSSAFRSSRPCCSLGSKNLSKGMVSRSTVWKSRISRVPSTGAWSISFCICTSSASRMAAEGVGGGRLRMELDDIRRGLPVVGEPRWKDPGGAVDAPSASSAASAVVLTVRLARLLACSSEGIVPMLADGPGDHSSRNSPEPLPLPAPLSFMLPNPALILLWLNVSLLLRGALSGDPVGCPSSPTARQSLLRTCAVSRSMLSSFFRRRIADACRAAGLWLRDWVRERFMADLGRFCCWPVLLSRRASTACSCIVYFKGRLYG
mmetsp:Transcript_71316/g.125515  ORF Transcript_71316/g.125515 Transcript_71316/m.125515 type:complete len:276 (-) Transcript_71316:831-1658(-)